MALTPEAKVKAKIKAFLRTLANCWFFFPAANGYGSTGVPDIVGCYKGVFFAIEVKRPGNLKGVTPLQQMQINAINQALGYAVAVDSVEAVIVMFNLIDAAMNARTSAQ